MNANTHNTMNASIILSNYFNAYKGMFHNSQQKADAKKSLEMLNAVYGTYEAMKDSIEDFNYLAIDMESDRQEYIKNYEYARTEAARNATWVLRSIKEMRKCGLPVDEKVVEAARNEIKDFRRAK